MTDALWSGIKSRHHASRIGVIDLKSTNVVNHSLRFTSLCCKQNSNLVSNNEFFKTVNKPLNLRYLVLLLFNKNRPVAVVFIIFFQNKYVMASFINLMFHLFASELGGSALWGLTFIHIFTQQAFDLGFPVFTNIALNHVRLSTEIILYLFDC